MLDPKRNDPSLHSVGTVRTVGNEGGVQDRGFVRCHRREMSVAVEECLKCEHKESATRGPGGVVMGITCLDLPSGAASNDRVHPLLLSRLTIADIMTRNVLCVRPDLSIDAVTQLFVESGLKAVPVVDDQGVLLGIVSESEVLLDVYAQESGKGKSALDEATRPRSVSDVMIPFAFTLPETAPVTRAAAVMAFEGTYRVTVVSAEGEVVGILSAADILYWLAKADGYALPPPKHLREVTDPI